MSESSPTIFGIDLGTTYSCIAYVDETGKAVVVPNDKNEMVTPSVIYFESKDNILVGKSAKSAARVFPDQVVELIKRDMGNPEFRREFFGEKYRPEDLSACILRKLKKDAETYLGRPVTDVVITVPAYFNEDRRKATEQAGKLADLNVRGIIPEPTAAAIAYALDHARAQNVLVYDLGGGTFDVTVIQVREGNIKVVWIGGDYDLGGRKWDDKLIEYFAAQWQSQTGRSESPFDDPQTMSDFYSLAEEAKKELSSKAKYPLSLNHAGHRARVEVTRELFDQLTEDLLARTVVLTRETLEKAKKMGVERIDRVLLVGGSSRMPQVEKRMLAETGLKCELFNPEMAVAMGAALYANNKAIQAEYEAAVHQHFGAEMRPEDLTPEQQKKAAATVAAKLPGTTAKQVASALQTRIVNCSSKSFGIVVLDKDDHKYVDYLIPKGSPVPATKEEQYGTESENQKDVDIRIIEAETDNPPKEPPSSDSTGGHCKEIKQAFMELPRGLPKGSPIKARFSLSEDGGCLEVTAVEVTTGRTLPIRIESLNALTQEEIEEKKQGMRRKNID